MYSACIETHSNKLLIAVLHLEMQVDSYNSISRIPLTLRHTVKARITSLLRGRHFIRFLFFCIMSRDVLSIDPFKMLI